MQIVCFLPTKPEIAMNINNIFNAGKISTLRILPLLLTLIRLLLGWHFLYEGLSKLFASHWSSVAYLLESHWLLADFFHWIAANPALLKIIDLINVWGLILIGTGLFFGMFTRLASAAGALLLLLYFIANPPLVGFIGEATAEGHYLIVNKNLIEFFLLFLFAFFPQNWYYSFDHFFSHFRQRLSPDKQEPASARKRAKRIFERLDERALFCWLCFFAL